MSVDYKVIGFVGKHNIRRMHTMNINADIIIGCGLMSTSGMFLQGLFKKYG